MGGQRHSKNAGTMGVEGLTYHEKKALGFGTVQQRLGKVNKCLLHDHIFGLCLLPTALLHHSLLKSTACLLKDSVGNYYDCRLTLQPAVVSQLPCLQHTLPLNYSFDCQSVDNLQDPVCTPEGFLFSKEAIIENLVQQKKAIKRKLAAWEAQQSDDQLKVNVFAMHHVALIDQVMPISKHIFVG